MHILILKVRRRASALYAVCRTPDEVKVTGVRRRFVDSGVGLGSSPPTHPVVHSSARPSTTALTSVPNILGRRRNAGFRGVPREWRVY